MSNSPPFLILDTSAVAKWFIHEPDADKAEKILWETSQGRWRLSAPFLMRCELAQVFWKRRHQGFDETRAGQCFQKLDALAIYEVDIQSLLPTAVQLSYQYDITVYDAVYVAMTQILQGVLATFDQALVKKVQKFLNLQVWHL